MTPKLNIYLVAPYTRAGCIPATMEEAIDYCQSQDLITIDTETRPKPEYKHIPKAGLDPYLNEVVMIQLGTTDRQYIIDSRTMDISKLKPLIESQSLEKVLVNAKFDYKTILGNYNIRMENVRDCMLQEMVIRCGHQRYGYSMDRMAERYLNFKFKKSPQLDLFDDESEVFLFKDIRLEFSHIKDKPFTEQQITYGAMDVVLPILIDKAQQKLIQEYDLSYTINEENEFCLVLGDIEYKGFHIDSDAWTEQYKQNLLHLVDARRAMDTYILDNELIEFYDWQKNLFTDEQNLLYNPSSSQQTIRLMNLLGINTSVIDKKKSKKTGSDIFKDSVEESHLKKYRSQFPIIPLYLNYKKYQKAVTTYGLKFLEDHIHPVTGRIHSSFRQILVTGRSASSGPNLQQIPSEANFPGFRKCFRAYNNRSLVVADYSNQEGRLLAELSGDANLVNFFLEGDGDLHSHTARLMFKVPVSKTENTNLRQVAKILNFGIAYGMSAYKLANDFEVTIEEAQAFIDKFYQSYPDLAAYFKKGHKHAVNRGFILINEVSKRRSWNATLQTMYDEAKREIEWHRKNSSTDQVPKHIWSQYYTAKGAIERHSQNYSIQGTAADMTKLACINLRKYIRDNNLWDIMSIVNVVHDEVVMDVDIIYSDYASKKLSTYMEEAGSIFCKTVPMIAEANAQQYWDH